jgi:uncharacterized protein (TIGR02217 family)
MTPFHDVRFPLDTSLRTRGGPERRTEIVTLGSGREERNARWAHSRRRYDAGSGVKTLAQLSAILAFFEERRGRLCGFRFRDRLDFRSSAAGGPVTPLDQALGTGTGTAAAFQLLKRYGDQFLPYLRDIRKPVAGTVRVAVDGMEKAAGADFTVDPATGVVAFLPGKVPAAGKAVTAGFEFDVPVRFDTDRLDIDLSTFEAGEAVSIPLIEILV